MRDKVKSRRREFTLESCNNREVPSSSPSCNSVGYFRSVFVGGYTSITTSSNVLVAMEWMGELESRIWPGVSAGI